MSLMTAPPKASVMPMLSDVANGAEVTSALTVTPPVVVTVVGWPASAARLPSDGPTYASAEVVSVAEVETPDTLAICTPTELELTVGVPIPCASRSSEPALIVARSSTCAFTPPLVVAERLTSETPISETDTSALLVVAVALCVAVSVAAPEMCRCALLPTYTSVVPPEIEVGVAPLPVMPPMLMMWARAMVSGVADAVAVTLPA